MQFPTMRVGNLGGGGAWAVRVRWVVGREVVGREVVGREVVGREVVGREVVGRRGGGGVGAGYGGRAARAGCGWSGAVMQGGAL